MSKAAIIAATLTVVAQPVMAQDINVPILAPLTGYISLEGTSQRNGAVLAIKNAPASRRSLARPCKARMSFIFLFCDEVIIVYISSDSGNPNIFVDDLKNAIPGCSDAIRER